MQEQFGGVKKYKHETSTVVAPYGSIGKEELNSATAPLHR